MVYPNFVLSKNREARPRLATRSRAAFAAGWPLGCPRCPHPNHVHGKRDGDAAQLGLEGAAGSSGAVTGAFPLHAATMTTSPDSRVFACVSVMVTGAPPRLGSRANPLANLEGRSRRGAELLQGQCRLNEIEGVQIPSGREHRPHGLTVRAYPFRRKMKS